MIMLSYSEYKLREAEEPTSPAASSQGGNVGSNMPDPISGMPPGDSSPAALGGINTSSVPGGGLGDIGGMPNMGSGMSDQKPSTLDLDASNFWDVLEKMFKKSKEENKA
jgi:hypothetical protein